MSCLPIFPCVLSQATAKWSYRNPIKVTYKEYTTYHEVNVRCCQTSRHSIHGSPGDLVYIHLASSKRICISRFYTNHQSSLESQCHLNLCLQTIHLIREGTDGVVSPRPVEMKRAATLRAPNQKTRTGVVARPSV